MLDLATLVDRAPHGIRRFAQRVAAGRGLLGRVADSARFRFSESDVPPVPPLSQDAVRLLIGPANSAGQGFEWARAIERHHPHTRALAMQRVGADPFRPSVDLAVPIGVYQRSRSWHSSFEAYLSQQSHVMWESGLPLLGRGFDSDVMREIEHFRERGVRGALLFHGSDIRPPARHAASNPWSPFVDSTGLTRTLEESAAENAALASASGVPVYVSTPDLLQWMPEATWLPVVVETARWKAAAASREQRARPVVAHAPSQKWLKGTDHIEPILRRLSDEGVIEYRQVVGVSHASMPSFYAEADIVLDQFVLGIYGVAACEAMASGRVVMSHVDAFTRTTVKERTGRELPVHETTIESLEAQLRLAAAEPHLFDSLRHDGPAFVDAVHNGQRSAAAIAPFLDLSA